jgi:hypothetical protein
MHLQFQFFEWDSIGTPERSWWVYFKGEVPKLAEMGVTIVWLPRECATPREFRNSLYHQSAPNRAMGKVSNPK